jgi:hypothetical protein
MHKQRRLCFVAQRRSRPSLAAGGWRDHQKRVALVWRAGRQMCIVEAFYVTQMFFEFAITSAEIVPAISDLS